MPAHLVAAACALSAQESGGGSPQDEHSTKPPARKRRGYAREPCGRDRGQALYQAAFMPGNQVRNPWPNPLRRRSIICLVEQRLQELAAP